MFTIRNFHINTLRAIVGAILPSRTRLQSDRIYYVRTDGSDSNDGLSDSAGGAFATIQKAVDEAVVLDGGNNNITIQVGDGTYNEHVNLQWHPNSRPIVLQGNTSVVGAVIIQGTSNHTISCSSGYWRVQHFELRNNSSAYNNVFAQFNCELLLGSGMQYGTTGGNHVSSYYGAKVTMLSSYNISGNAVTAIFAAHDGWIYMAGINCTFVGTRSFSYSFIALHNGSSIRATGFTWSGTSPTGVRYRIQENSVLNTANFSSTYFPGSSNGIITTGGLYS